MSMDVEPPSAEATTAAVTSQQLQYESPGRHDDVSGGSSPPSSRDGGGEEGDSPEKRQKMKNRRRKSRRRLDIPNDGCLWQKYGQKHIKGTTIIRYYYKCSLFKDAHCPGKRTVEYHKEDPNTLHIQYPEKHNHQLVLPIPPRKKIAKILLNQSGNATMVPSIHRFLSPTNASCSNSSFQSAPIFEEDPSLTNIRERNSVRNDVIPVVEQIENRYGIYNRNKYGIDSRTGYMTESGSRKECGNENINQNMNIYGNENNSGIVGNMDNCRIGNLTENNEGIVGNMNNCGIGNGIEIGNRHGNGNVACESMAFGNTESPLRNLGQEDVINLPPGNVMEMENSNDSKLKDQWFYQRAVSGLDNLIMMELIRAKIREAEQATGSENRNSNLTEMVSTEMVSTENVQTGNVQMQSFPVGNVPMEKNPLENVAWNREEGRRQMRVEEQDQSRENAISTNFPGFHAPDDSVVLANETRSAEVRVDPFSLLGGRDTLKVADFADVPEDFFWENPQRLTSPLTQDPPNETDYEDPWTLISNFGFGEDGMEF